MADDYKITIVLEGDNKLSQTVRVAGGDLRRFADDTRNAANQTGMFERQTRSMTDTLRTFAGGVLGGLALREVVNFAESMNELGTEVNANRILFEQLTSTLGGGTAVLRDLRAATGDVVDDMTLMAGANQLLRLGITETSDQTADLIGMIQRLKQPTESTTDAIQNFALMLSNESLLRLDSFGISSANVKRRMDELGQSFREATMAEMAGQIERLGDAADVAITPLARIQTGIENIVQQLGAGLNTGTNSLAAFLLAMAEHGDVAWANITGQTYLSPDELARVERILSIRREIQAGSNQQPWLDMSAAEHQLLQGSVPVISEDQARAMTVWMRPYLDLVDRMRTISGGIRGIQGVGGLLGLPDIQTMTAYDVELANIVMRMGEINDIGLRDTVDASGFYDRTFSTYLTSGEAQDIVNHYEMIKAAADRIKDAMGDAITDQQAATLQQYVDGAKDLADQAERAAKAYENLNLSGLLGTTGGGVMGELTDRFMAVLRDRGVSDSTIAQYQQTLDLANGRATPLSQGLDEFLSSLSYMSPQDVATAIDNLAQSLQEARHLGLPPSAFMPGNFGFFAGMANIGSGAQGEIVYGDNTWTLADRYGGKPSDYNYLIGEDGILRPGKFNLGGGELISGFDPAEQIKAYADSFGSISTEADIALDPMITDSESVLSTFEGVQSILDDITGTVHKVTIDLDVRIPAILEWLFNQSGTDWMKNIITANGGVPPGSDTRGAGGGGSLR